MELRWRHGGYNTRSIGKGNNSDSGGVRWDELKLRVWTGGIQSSWYLSPMLQVHPPTWLIDKVNGLLASNGWLFGVNIYIDEFCVEVTSLQRRRFHLKIQMRCCHLNRTSAIFLCIVVASSQYCSMSLILAMSSDWFDLNWWSMATKLIWCLWLGILFFYLFLRTPFIKCILHENQQL
jgi:hypothetical protein